VKKKDEWGAYDINNAEIKNRIKGALCPGARTGQLKQVCDDPHPSDHNTTPPAAALLRRRQISIDISATRAPAAISILVISNHNSFR